MTALERPSLPGVYKAHGGSQRAGQASPPKRVLLQFRVIANALRSPGAPVRIRHTVAGRKLMALHAIAHAPGMGVKDLARTLNIRQPTASQMVKALASLQLVEVKREGRDRRAVQIHASIDGKAVLGSLPARFDFGDRLPNALARLDDDSLCSLERGLAGVLQALARSVPVLKECGDVVPRAGSR